MPSDLKKNLVYAWYSKPATSVDLVDLPLMDQFHISIKDYTCHDSPQKVPKNNIF